MSSRYFVEDALQPGEMDLEGPEAHHLLHVMRAKPGERIVLFCGDGTESAAEVVETGKKSVLLRVAPSLKVDRELPFPLHIATAFPKGDRADFLIEKLVELGVSELTPIHSERSVVQVRLDKLDKFRRQVIEASKQCGRNRLMKINVPMDFDKFVRQPRSGGKWLPHPGGKLFQPTAVASPQAFCIGPEGGFTDAEVEMASLEGWQTISLGNRVLRTETACLAASIRASNGL